MGAGLVAGILIGLSVYFFSSLAQWPIVRRFLNTSAIKDAHSELTGRGDRQQSSPKT